MTAWQYPRHEITDWLVVICLAASTSVSLYYAGHLHVAQDVSMPVAACLPVGVACYVLYVIGRQRRRQYG